MVLAASALSNAASSVLPSGPQCFALLFAGLWAWRGYTRAEAFASQNGRSPWGWTPTTWSAVCFCLSFIGRIMLQVAGARDAVNATMRRPVVPMSHPLADAWAPPSVSPPPPVAPQAPAAPAAPAYAPPPPPVVPTAPPAPTYAPPPPPAPSAPVAPLVPPTAPPAPVAPAPPVAPPAPAPSYPAAMPPPIPAAQTILPSF